MRKFSLSLIALVTAMTVIATNQNAPQAQAVPTTAAQPAPVIPKLDELDTAWVQNVSLAREMANNACQGLDVVKNYQQLLTAMSSKIEARHPGFTMDWGKGVLAVKPPPVTVTK